MRIEKDRRKMILEANVLRMILILSIPTLMMAFVQSMIPFTDGIFLNNIIGPIKAGAITYSQPALNMLLGLSQGLSVAAMAMIGQMAGKGDIENVKKISLQILMFSIICGIILMPSTIIIAKYLSTTVNKTMASDVYLYVTLYSMIIPFQFVAGIFNAIKNSTGNPEASFVRMTVLLILKIIFNTIFLKYLNMGIKGAVFASFSAYAICAIWMYYDLFQFDSLYRLEFKGYKFDKNIIMNLVKLSIPSMISYMMISMGFLLINLEVSHYGPVVIAGLGISSNITNLCFQLPSCIGTTVTSMVSINIGMDYKKRAKKVFITACIVSLIISIITIIVLIPNVSYVTELFTKNNEVLNISNQALRIYTYSILPYGLFMMCQSVYNALGKNVLPLIMSVLRMWVFRYLFIIFTQDKLGYFSVFYGNLFSNVVAAIIFAILISKIKWKTGIKYG